MHDTDVFRVGCDPTAPGSEWHTLGLDLDANGAVGTIDGKQVTHGAVAVNVTSGSASVGSGWHTAWFDDFSVTGG